MNDATKVAPEPSQEKWSTREEEQLRALLAAPKIELAELAACWRAFEETGRLADLDLYQRLSKVFLGMDAPLLAYDVASAGLKHASKDLELRRRQGLALARVGALERANQLAAALVADGHQDEETLGLVARIHKDLGLFARHPATRAHHCAEAFKIYHATFKESESYWHGINAATLLVLGADVSGADKLAREIENQLAFKQANSDDEHYWMLATLGEAALIRGRWQDAADSYREAVSVGKADQVVTTRKQARLLMDHLQDQRGLKDDDRADIEACFDIPRVVVFVGHMVDDPERRNVRPERFPEALADAVGARIADELKKLGKVVGFSSAACGSDILFLEAVQKAGGETHVVLPYAADDFARASVDFAGPDWRKRFNEVLDPAKAQVTTVSPRQKLSFGSVSYDYANLVLSGMARIHAQGRDTDLVRMAVWDGKDGDGLGGTASVVRRWQEQPQPTDVIIDPATIMKEQKYVPRRQNRSAPSAPNPRTASRGVIELRASMFIDVVHFTELADEQMPDFVEHFLCMVANMARISPDRPVVQETRGDGVFFAFETVDKAGRFALDVRDRLHATAWLEHRLPEDFRVRIGLHAGPVHEFICPFAHKPSYTGHHVSLAARIESSTPEGEVFASLGFTALASEERVVDFHCEYSGLVVLPKKSGTIPIYHVRRRG